MKECCPSYRICAHKLSSQAQHAAPHGGDATPSSAHAHPLSLYEHTPDRAHVGYPQSIGLLHPTGLIISPFVTAPQAASSQRSANGSLSAADSAVCTPPTLLLLLLLLSGVFSLRGTS